MRRVVIGWALGARVWQRGPTSAAEVGAVRDEPRGDAVGVSKPPRAAALLRPHPPPQVRGLHLVFACRGIPSG